MAKEAIEIDSELLNPVFHAVGYYSDELAKLVEHVADSDLKQRTNRTIEGLRSFREEVFALYEKHKQQEK